MSILSELRPYYFTMQWLQLQSKHWKLSFQGLVYQKKLLATMGLSLWHNLSKSLQNTMESNILIHLLTIWPLMGQPNMRYRLTAMKKMTPSTLLTKRLAEFLLIYRNTLHATTGMRPDELFLRWRIKPALLSSPQISHHRWSSSNRNRKQHMMGRNHWWHFKGGRKC